MSRPEFRVSSQDHQGQNSDRSRLTGFQLQGAGIQLQAFTDKAILGSSQLQAAGLRCTSAINTQLFALQAAALQARAFH